jgi:hypothetical protein
MSPQVGQISPQPHEDIALVQLKNVRVDGVGKGRLSLTDHRIEFEHKEGLFSTPHRELSIELSSVRSVEVDEASYAVLLDWTNPDGERVMSRLLLPRGEAADDFCQSVDRILERLRYEAKLERQKAAYQTFIWTTAYNMWATVGTMAMIPRELAREGWPAVDASLKEVQAGANALAEAGAVDITSSVQALMQAASSREPPVVLRSVTANLEAIATALQGGLPNSDEWDDLTPDDMVGLSWQDLRYVFLFAARYNLLPFWQRLGQSSKVDDSLARLARFSSILERKLPRAFPAEAAPDGEKGPRVVGSADEAAQEVEASLKMNAGIA